MKYFSYQQTIINSELFQMLYVGYCMDIGKFCCYSHQQQSISIDVRKMANLLFCFYFLSLHHFFSQDYLYISDLRNRSVISFSKTSHEVKNFGSFRSTVSPYAMTIFSAESQPATVEDHEARELYGERFFFVV